MKISRFTVSAFAVAMSLQAASQAFAISKRIGGVIDGFGQMQKDDVLDGAIVLPTLRPAALLAFQFENLLGASEDMKAGPMSVKVPGNFYFPKQKESYGIFPITIQKENFGLHIDSRQSEELLTLSFQAPFSKLVAMAKDNKPFTGMLPHLRLKRAAFEGNRTWPDQSAIRISLNRDFKSDIPYSWTRTAGGSEAVDSVIMFQSTPAGRWAISDINGQATPTGALKRIDGLGNSFKSFFIRAFTRAGQQSPYAVVGQIRTGMGTERHVAGNLPEPLADVSIQGADRVNWRPFNQNGWVSLARSGGGNSGPQFFMDFSLGLSTLPTLMAASDWVNPSQGYIKLAKPIATGENMLLVFIGTSRAVSAPAMDDENPQLFTFAEEIRMATIKK